VLSVSDSVAARILDTAAQQKSRVPAIARFFGFARYLFEVGGHSLADAGARGRVETPAAGDLE
jgi:hypothetical protein